ncbi:uncharacterized protein LOC110449706 [Mizuhopecten yessoensis]|uniref:J domain-containing protein n=1 Tax=Mizuhopecten yessoensis TaxID=6573 RepID=A0A210QQK2_MIZYE|nr:uncharacterized protein LOC110449706 [Mizuhopecten yessoensis]XP_021352418.1 uncharacterized protein LOC110449706 [Mizuhopecten yessoensis]XP_021352419.1 uncharacterized protein LOC110449706 [Mizuhopecten yessoensis]XP_021352420.1 uncharacterized protein LOC110449706 [Mizuhopecten yessoensis]OWF51012.1 hypothetical protein KP79_PYT19605 [Mizuhopecten yessoensis]
MGCVESKQTHDESNVPYSRKQKESRKKNRKRNKDDRQDEYTIIQSSDQNYCIEVVMENKSNAKFPDQSDSNEGEESSAQYLECHTEAPTEKKNESNTEFLNKSNSDEDEESSDSSEQYSDSESYTEAHKEKNNAPNTDFPYIKGANEPSENTTEADSLSVRLRKKGNESYTSVAKSLDTTVSYKRFSKAADCYCRAFEAAAKDEESVSAAKNAAMAYWRLAEAGILRRSTARKTILHYKEAFKFFSYAYKNGILCNTEAWRTKLCTSIDSCWLDFTRTTDMHFNLEDRIDLYYKSLQTVEIDHIRGNLYLNLARFHFRNGVTAIQNGHYQRGLSEMSNCSMPIHEARTKCLDAQNVGLECDSLEDDIIMHTCTADAMQAIDVGDKLFEQTIKDDEEVNMDMVWDVVDWYKVAVLRTRERTEMEQEAIAASRLGNIYDKVLKMKEKAKEYVMRSIQLAHSMHPRTFNSDEWFKDASNILKKYQDETQADEDAEWNKEREEIKKEMKEQLDELETANKKGDLEFLDYVYKKFPPKNPLHKELYVLPADTSDIDHSKTKKLYQKAVVNYHPDRANVEENGVQWKVMTEEITKLFNCRYNRMKGE